MKSAVTGRIARTSRCDGRVRAMYSSVGSASATASVGGRACSATPRARMVSSEEIIVGEVDGELRAFPSRTSKPEIFEMAAVFVTLSAHSATSSGRSGA